MSELDDSPHNPLTDPLPKTAVGPATGPAGGTEIDPLPDGQPEPERAPQTAPVGNPGGLSAAVQAHLTGEPGTLPPTWCRNCQVEVKPEGKGRCPRCGAFLKLNFIRRRHPVNKLRCH